MKSYPASWVMAVGMLAASELALIPLSTQAALLAYEPFTNAVGTAIIGSSDGWGFSGAWQLNSSGGVATNTGYGLTYIDGASHKLVTVGGAGLFQGLTTANTSMQCYRLFSFRRGTNAADATTTWLSFLVARHGPTGTLTGNPYGRGANIAHDINSGAVQKLAIGNSSGAATNTVGLIPQGNSNNLKSSTNTFGNCTNFVVVRIDHVSGGNDSAWLFVNPNLAIEPSTNAASASSLGGFDFSFDRVRTFAGGSNTLAQPYAEMVVDEYRVGETYADVTPYTSSAPPAPTGPIIITNAALVCGHLVLSGTGGTPGGSYYVLAAANPTVSATNWLAVATNRFDASGNFNCTNGQALIEDRRFFRVMAGGTPPASPIAPYITEQPQDQSVRPGQDATFAVVAGGDPTLHYQWYFNTNTVLANATNTALTIVNVQSNNAGAYFVRVTNSVGSITSAVATLTVNPEVSTNGAFFVSPSGSDTNPGTLDQPYLTISKGLTSVGNGGLLYLRGGIYALSSKLGLTKTASPANRIRIWAFPGETPVIDNTGIGGSIDGISISGHWYHLKGLEQKNATHNGINISGNSNIVEHCTVHDNGNTGLHITGGSSGSTYPACNLILNCDAYLNYDPPKGENADGFSAKWNLGAGNLFSGCRAWLNSDDGWDLWMGNSPVTITNCWAFWSGSNYWNSSSFDGNGNGFKLGGSNVAAAHRLVRSVAFVNLHHGIDQNNNTAGLTVDQNTSWANGGKNLYLDHGANTTPHVVRNNLSFDGGTPDTPTSGLLATNNSWQVISPNPTTSDVQSAVVSCALAPRQADGSLPNTPFLRPVSGGRLVDQGIDLGEPYLGSAPDLGAFEVVP
jgi:hypothetical protein